MQINNITYSFLSEIARSKEGLVLLGAGGDLNEWINGVSELLKDEGIALPNFAFTEAHKIDIIGGRIDLLLTFDFATVDVGKLAMWRIRFGDCSWLSDYIPNYGYEVMGAVGPM